jgi:glycosyltransferase involved in cell wall biosynthesis
MRSSFDNDPYPGRPKILFIGFTESSHTHSWINLLESSELNVRLFGLPSAVPPDDFKVRTYVTGVTAAKLNAETRSRFYSRSRIGQLSKKGFSRLLVGDVRGFEEKWLAKIIRQWRPDVIHTLGLEPAAYVYNRVRARFDLHRIGKWVATVRGGPDLALRRLLPENVPRIRSVLTACDKLVADNRQNYEYALALGLNESQIAEIGEVPGTGGIDVEYLSKSWCGTPSERRLILWPKAFECNQSKALPVLEALRLSWDQMPPCEVHMLAIMPEVRMWFQTLPDRIRSRCTLSERLPRPEALELMTNARIMLAPTLSDGVPNSMLEAMAAGAFPIVSPLETIRPIVEDERNVLFARNLYPTEIAAALSRAMTDDVLVNRAAEANLTLVRQIANRAVIRPRVIEFYNKLTECYRSNNLNESFKEAI